MLEKIIDIVVNAGKIVMQIREEGFQTQTKDDSFDYKYITESVGINFIHFRNPKRLKIELKEYGIKF